MDSKPTRMAVSGILVAAATIVGIAGFEGFREEAYVPVKGDVYTIGYGSTKGVKKGDRITPERALHRLLDEVDSEYAQGVRRCVKVPLYQYEFAAMVSITYNIGVNAFCNSTLVKKLNAGDYEGACSEFTKWVYVKGKKLNGLVKRRAEERAICEGRRT